ncbi:MAG: DUF58 domain-containing protein [Cellvibrio sp.]|jgi:uncharacterized protein (DUF58 family)
MNTRFRLVNSLRNRFWQWVVRRAPKAPTVTLQHKSIYIFPGRQGLLFILVLGLMWLLGTNYENNLILAAAFLLLSMMVVSMIHAFRNLSGLRITALGSQPVFAGEYVQFDVLLEAAPRTDHENIQLSFAENVSVAVDIPRTGEHRLTLSAKTHQRGWFQPGRLSIKSHYPLGLIRAWSWVQLDARALVYPVPLPSAAPPMLPANSHHGDYLSRENSEDFQGFQRYQAGAPLAHVAWKQFARGAGLHLKDYVGYQNQQVWLDWDGLPGLDTETRLSQLCYWTLELARTHTEFGLRLPGCVIELGSGHSHQLRVLRALALFGIDEAGGPDHDA